jgi:hypothetical protein
MLPTHSRTDNMLSDKQSKQPSIRCLSGLMAVLITLLTLASSSPDLHAYLHGKQSCEHNCDSQNDAPAPDTAQGGHVCAVTFLATGSSILTPVATPERTDQLLSIVLIEMESIWCGQAPIRLGSRAPPMSPLV